jgi:hypothetical protein
LRGRPSFPGKGHPVLGAPPPIGKDTAWPFVESGPTAKFPGRSPRPCACRAQSAEPLLHGKTCVNRPGFEPGLPSVPQRGSRLACPSQPVGPVSPEGLQRPGYCRVLPSPSLPCYATEPNGRFRLVSSRRFTPCRAGLPATSRWVCAHRVVAQAQDCTKRGNTKLYKNTRMPETTSQNWV